MYAREGESLGTRLADLPTIPPWAANVCTLLWFCPAPQPSSDEGWREWPRLLAGAGRRVSHCRYSPDSCVWWSGDCHVITHVMHLCTYLMLRKRQELSAGTILSTKKRQLIDELTKTCIILWLQQAKLFSCLPSCKSRLAARQKWAVTQTHGCWVSPPFPLPSSALSQSPSSSLLWVRPTGRATSCLSTRRASPDIIYIYIYIYIYISKNVRQVLSQIFLQCYRHRSRCWCSLI